MPVTRKQPVGSSIETVYCDFADELIEELNKSYRLAGGTQILFRGQNKDDPRWTLLPLAMRRDFQQRFVNREFERLKNRITGSDLCPSTELNSLGEDNLRIYIQRRVEEYIVRQFARIADEARLYVPTDSYMELGGQHTDLKDHEICDALEGNFPELYEPRALAFALAQHHRIPTRLLDWTFKPLIAAFFAAYEWPRYKPLGNVDHAEVGADEEQPCAVQYWDADESSNMVIWAVSRSILNEKDTNLRLITQLRTRIGNLQAQDGVFIYDINADKKYRENREWMPFEKELEKINAGNCVYKFLLTSEQRPELLRRLEFYGISAANIMPSFDHVANSALLYYSKYPHRLYWRYP